MPSTVLTLADGVDPTPAYGQKEFIGFFNTWAVGDTWKVNLVSSNGNCIIGVAEDADGNALLVGTNPTFGITFSGRIYLANGQRFTFSDNNDPTGWYEQNPGAGYVALLSNVGGQDAVTSFAPYQGKLAAFLRRSIQIWNVNADIAQFSQSQILSNIGTAYGQSVQALGDWDVLFLADSGVRSLRVRDASNNALTTDIGSPIDQVLQAVLLAGSVGTPVSIVEPTCLRYWLFLKDTIYVLSFFVDGQIRAWSTYAPTTELLVVYHSPQGVYGSGIVVPVTTGAYYYFTKGNATSLVNGTETLAASGFFTAQGSTVTVNGGAAVVASFVISAPTQTTFVPTKFVIKDGMVYCRATISGSDYLISYATTYDSCIATVQSPFLSLHIPSTNKKAQAVDIAVSGTWSLSLSLDQDSGTFETVASLTKATYDGGKIPLAADGTHMAFKLTSSPLSRAAAVASTFTLIYQTAEVR